MANQILSVGAQNGATSLQKEPCSGGAFINIPLCCISSSSSRIQASGLEPAPIRLPASLSLAANTADRTSTETFEKHGPLLPDAVVDVQVEFTLPFGDASLDIGEI